MAKKFIIYAPSISETGGSILLDELLKSASKGDYEFISLSKRNGNTHPWIKFINARKGFLGRIHSELWLYKNSQPGSIVLCFGNLPPLFKLKGCTMVFLQNAFFLNKFKYFENFSFSIFFKKIIFKALTRNIDKVILQSGLMAEIWKQSYPNIELIVLPIVPAIDCAKFQTNEKCYDFIYVATGHGYKNHTLLINAWINLARNGFFPRLCLVLRATSDAQLIKYIKNIAAENSLSIIILADLVHNDVLSVYGKSKCLIYPSLVESFGLPLVEASLLGLDIIASDLDYVFEVCSPTIVFNPDCLGSVVRAVCKYMGYKIIGNNYDYINGKDYIAKIIEGKR